jgi:DNA segregation ATPase FtsK/SpoIIIE, S-DNA-T family
MENKKAQAKKVIKNTLLFLAVFTVCIFVVSQSSGVLEMGEIITGFALATLIVFVWKKIDKRYFQKDFSSEFGESIFDDGDSLYKDAERIVLTAKAASASLLQRRLRVGYARAARLLDMLEENGIIGEADGEKPRKVLQ